MSAPTKWIDEIGVKFLLNNECENNKILHTNTTAFYDLGVAERRYLRSVSVKATL